MITVTNHIYTVNIQSNHTMKNFLNNVLTGNSINPPESCMQAFNLNFGDAVRTDWYRNGNGFEAIFYRDNLEHIALFTQEGTLLEYKANLPEGYLPEILKSRMEARGEIMNAVLRNKGNLIDYEVIVRDRDLNRFLITVSGSGQILEEKKL